MKRPSVKLNPNYIKYKSYIERAVKFIVVKSKKAKKGESSTETITMSTGDTGTAAVNGTETMTTSNESLEMPTIKDPIELEKIVKDSSKPVGHLDGNNWVWPDGRKTHLRFIGIAVRKYKPLPLGFYDAVAKSDRKNLKQLVNKAKHLKLLDNVEEP